MKMKKKARTSQKKKKKGQKIEHKIGDGINQQPFLVHIFE
jgi:hypothetical protein